MQGQQRLTFHTAHGAMEVRLLREFPETIAWQCLDDRVNSVEIARNNFDPVPFARSSELPTEAVYKRLTYELKEIFKLTGPEQMLLMKGVSVRDQIEHKLRQSAMKKIEEEFKVMVAQKTPDFFVKDLTMDAVQDLANKYAEKFGDDTMYGIDVRLSPYQKFFAITSPNYFKFYFTDKRQEITTLDWKWLGRLIDHNPEKWVMGRYEHLTYLNEMTAMQRYTPPDKIPPELMAEALVARRDYAENMIKALNTREDEE